MIFATKIREAWLIGSSRYQFWSSSLQRIAIEFDETCFDCDEWNRPASFPDAD